VIKQVKNKTERAHKREKSSDSTPKATTKDSQRALMDSFKKESILDRVDEHSGVSPREEKSNPARSGGHKRKISITNAVATDDITLDGSLPVEPVLRKVSPKTDSVLVDAVESLPDELSRSRGSSNPQLSDSESVKKEVLGVKKDSKTSSHGGSDGDSSD
jgi:hypothetical protein